MFRLHRQTNFSADIMDMLCVGLIIVSLFPLSTISTTLKLERAFPVERNLTKIMHRDQVRQQGIIGFDLHGSSHVDYFGFYFTKVLIGSPPREFNLLVDTGSDITWVSCKHCDGCPSFNKFGIQLQPYDPYNSTSNALISCSDRICLTKSGCRENHQLCPYEIKYEDQSFSKGFFVADIFHFSTTMSGSAAHISKSVIFGCSNYLSGRMAKSNTTVDGILGLMHNGISILSQVSSSGIIPQVFSHCLRGDNGGGLLVLGEILELGVVYTPLLPSRGAYNVNLQGIHVNGKAIQIDAADRGTVVDTGTTLIYIAEKAYDRLISNLIATVWQYALPVLVESIQCFQVANGVDDIFPPISFHFEGGASIILKPRDYLIYNLLDNVETWCAGFRKGHGITILGEILLKDKIIIYDLSRQRFGWVDYNCSKSVNVSSTYESSRRPQRASNSKLNAPLKSILASSAVLLYISLF